MQIKRGVLLGLSALVVSPLALGLGLVFLVAALGNDNEPGLTASGALRIGAGYVPAQYAAYIEAAAANCDQGLSPGVLAAQLEAESNFSPTADSGQAQGIAQFTPDSWRTWGDGKPDDIWDPAAAITAQGKYMCSLLKEAKKHPDYNGSPIELALAGYNAGWGRVDQFRGVPPKSFADGQTYDYVQEIMANVAKLTSPPSTSGAVTLPAGYTLPAGTPDQVRTAVAWALQQVGGNYSFGGSCTKPLGSDPATQCDCSSLMEQAYAHAGITIPRVSQDQVNIGQRESVDDPKPGDLVFSPGVGDGGSDAHPGHVGMYIGDGMLVEAPHTGAQIRVVTYSSWRNSSSASTHISAVVRVVNW